jgi:succinyl-diaminopimelate desuccinylase
MSADRVLAAVDALAGEAVAFTSDLVRLPTVNPPGESYDECARFIGATLTACGLDVEYHAAEGRPEHTPSHPRINVVGTRRGRALRPLVHLNGHFDVVPAGSGWTVDPFGGEIRDGKIWGRGTCDMKAGIAAAVFAVEAIRRAGVDLHGSVARTAPTSSSSRSPSASIASASGTAASTGSRSRREDGSPTAACRSRA